MKKCGLVIVCLLICSVFLSGCNYKPRPKQQTINYQRKYEKYLPTEQSNKSSNGAVDLSEGPRLKYDARFGPSDMNFDVKVINPYNF